MVWDSSEENKSTDIVSLTLEEKVHVNYLEPIWCYPALLHPLNSCIL